jgi:hypothetical protein
MVELPNNEEAQQVLTWLQGKEDGVQRSLRAYPEAGTEWFLKNMAWLYLWKICEGARSRSAAV